MPTELIYLASPYSHPDADVRRDRFERVCVAAGLLLENGHLVYSPIAHSHSIAELSYMATGWVDWSRLDAEMLRRCDRVIVLMIDGWEESKGIMAEVALAEQMGMRVTYMTPDEVCE